MGKIIIIIVVSVLFLTSCDELFNPKEDSYAIEKTLTENAMTQEFSSSDDIKITVTGGTIKEETEIKVKKVSASDVPNLTLDKTVIGKNIFKIKIKGQKTFSPALKIEIKYDEEYLKSKNLTTADIKGLVHLPSGWVLGTYSIDQTNKKIIFSISATSLPSKVKDGLLDEEEEITICDGYLSTLDQGQGDEFLAKLKFYEGDINFGCMLNDNIHTILGFSTSNLKESSTGKITWDGTKLTIAESSAVSLGYKIYKTTGEIDKQKWTLKNYKIECEIFEDHLTYTTVENYTIYLNDLAGSLIQHPNYPDWVYFDTGINDDEVKDLDLFKKTVKSITYKKTMSDIEGGVSEFNMTSIDWNFSSNHFYIYLYQQKQ